MPKQPIRLGFLKALNLRTMTETLIILAAGASSRMKQSLSDASLGNIKSKALISLGKDNQPLLDYLLLNAQKAGYSTIYLVVGEAAEAFKKYYENNSYFSELTIRFATQHIPNERSKPFGTADAVLQTLEQFPELQRQTFSVCNADNLYSSEALEAVRRTDSPQAFISYDRNGLQFSTERISAFALVILDPGSYLTHIVEKPNPSELEPYRQLDGSFRVSMNLWKLDGAKIYPFLKNCPVHRERNEKELPTAILNMIRDYPKSVLAIPFNEHVPDLTSIEDIAVLKKYIDDHFSS